MIAGKKYDWAFGINVSEADKIQKWLIDGEGIRAMFRVKENIGVFTDKRIIFKGIANGDVKLIGREVYMYNIPYTSIVCYAYEVSDSTLINSFIHLDLWLIGGEQLGIFFDKRADISAIKKILLDAVITK